MSLRAQKAVSPPVLGLTDVLHGLGVTRIEHDFNAQATGANADDSSEMPALASMRPALKLHQPHDETAIQISDTKQLQQIGRHLIRWRTELQRQQAQLQTEQKHWTRQMQLEHEVIAEKNAKLDHRERQIKSIEFQLMQLQNDVIDAQVALQQTVAELTECKLGDNRDGRTIAALTTLRFELNERFEYLVKRWQRLQSEMQPADR